MRSLRKLLPSRLSVPRGHEWQERDQRISAPNLTYRDIAQSAKDASASCSHFLHVGCFRKRSSHIYPPNYLPLLFLLALLVVYSAVSLLSVDISTKNAAHYARISERPIGGLRGEHFSRQNEQPGGAGGQKKYYSTTNESTHAKIIQTKKTPQHKRQGQDYYALLGISQSASPEEIKKAYRLKTYQPHADKGGNSEDYKKFAMIARAYEVLSDEKKKKAYDRKHKKKSGEDGDGSTPHKEKAKKRPPHSHSQKKDKPRKSMRGQGSKRRRIPGDKDKVVESEGSGGEGSVDDLTKKEGTGDAVIAGVDRGPGTERAAPNASGSSTNDVVVGLAVTAAVAIVAFLGTLAYIFANKQGSKQKGDGAKQRDSQTERGSDFDSEDSDGALKTRDSVATRDQTKPDQRSLSVSGDLEASVLKIPSSTSPSVALFSVTVPNGVQPGQDFRVLAGNQVISVKCPPSSKAGSKVQISVAEGAQTEDEDIETSEESFVPLPCIKDADVINRGLDGAALASLNPCSNSNNTRESADGFAKNPQEGASTIFEVAVPNGVEPGQSFPVMVEGTKIVVNCPADISSRRKIVFQLPSDTGVIAS